MTQFPVELVCRDVHGEDAQRAILQQAIGEAAGGAADVEADFAVWRDLKILQRALQFQAAAADVGKRVADYFDARVSGNLCAGLLHFLAVHQDAACQQDGLGALAGGSQAPFDDCDVESNFS